MFLCFILFLTVLVTIEGCEGPVWFRRLYVDKEINVYKGNVSLIGSKRDCAFMCSTFSNCHSFQYNRKSGRCITHPVSFEALWEHNAVIQSGSVVYHRIGTNAIGSKCSVDGDCVSVGAICFQVSQACVCEPGYSYHLPTDTCLTACQVYGSEVTVYKGLYIADNNLRIIDGMTVDECLTECITDNACRPFDYIIDLNKCIIQAVGFLDVPSAGRSGRMDLLHGHRDCAS